MHTRSEGSAAAPAAIALCLMSAIAALVLWPMANARAAQFKMVMCAADSGTPAFTTETNTANAQHPYGIFDFTNHCGGQGGDPPGDSAFLRIAEHESAGNAGQGSYGRFVFNTPAYIHFKAAGSYTRQPNAFNDGWRSRFWGLGFDNAGHTFVNQGAGLSSSGTDRPSSNTFGPHLWPFTYLLDFHHFYFELLCVRPAGCDRQGFNATDANGFVVVLNDDEAPDLYFLAQGSELMQGKWVSGAQWVPWYLHDNGSGIRNEWISIDGKAAYSIDHQALGQCNATSSPANGEFARTYQPCPQGPYWHDWTLDSASLADGAHTLEVCTQDYGQYRGLNGSGGQTCDRRTIHTDNHPPGAPVGLEATSANPNRYLPEFGARWTLPPDSGSPLASLHYNVVDAEGEVVVPAQTIAGPDLKAIPSIEGPAKPGDYRLRVWLEDSVGLTGPAATVAVPRDTTPPAAPQDVSVAAPESSRAARGFDVSWRDLADAGSPIDAAHYQVLDGSGQVVVPTETVRREQPDSIESLATPRGRGTYTLRLWLSDAEGNTGSAVSAPLAYECERAEASGGVSLSAGLGSGTAETAQVRQGQGSLLGGSLRAADGAGLEGAPVCVFESVLTGSQARFLGYAMSGADGRYGFAVEAGPSRRLSVRYRSGQREIEASATLLTRVRPVLRVARHVIRNGRLARFFGSIPGPDNDRVLVVLQARSGKGWRAFRRYRTRGGGRFSVRYRFTRTTTPATFVIRAQVRSQAGYPYLQGNSRALKVHVRP